MVAVKLCHPDSEAALVCRAMKGFKFTPEGFYTLVAQRGDESHRFIDVIAPR